MIHQRISKTVFGVILAVVIVVLFRGDHFWLGIAVLILGGAFRLIERIFPAPAWYKHEREESGVTALDLTESRKEKQD